MADIDIKDWRTKRRLTQQELAELLGVAIITLRSWETNKYEPRHPIMLKLALQQLGRKYRPKRV